MKQTMVDYNEIAACLAHECDDVQSKFFEVFAKELQHICVTQYKTEIQCHGIRHNIPAEQMDVFETIAYREGE